MDLSEVPEAFDTHQLWRRSIFSREDLDPALEPGSTLFPSLELDLNTIKIDNPYAPSKDLEHDLRLPGLDAFQFGPLEELESIQESAASSEAERLPTDHEVPDDIWKIALELGPSNRDVKFNTWEGFEKPGHLEPGPAYISEAGPAVFDAALDARSIEQGKANQTGKNLRQSALLTSLFNVGLGRSSILFGYDAEKKAFIQAVEGGKLPGLTLQSAQSLVTKFVSGGAAFRLLRDYTEKTYASQSSLPTRVALANAVAGILSTLETHLGDKFPSVQSLLQLQRIYDKPQTILLVIKELAQYVSTVRTNEDLVSRLYYRIQIIEHENEWLRAVLLEILSRVSKPWLEFAEHWTGLHQSAAGQLTKDRLENTFVELEEMSEDPAEAPAVVNYLYKPEGMPAFISEDDGEMIFETGKSLRFLETHHAEHPLCSPLKHGIAAPQLDWKFGWQDMEDIASKAKEYERNIIDAIRDFSHGRSVPSTVPVVSLPEAKIPAAEGSPEDFERYLQETGEMFDADPTSRSEVPRNDIRHFVLSCLGDSTNEDDSSTIFAPPISVTANLTLTPFFITQARIVNATTLRLFFRSHGLRHHLSLQRQYQLFGDGVFMSRLTSALFSPELETAERQRGIVRTGAPMGLKLGTRSTWPPASSELRLALMGVLSESYHASRLYHSSKSSSDAAGTKNDEAGIRESPNLPGNLSFAIRTLPAEDADKCMDPNSLYALDFLRLQYTAPAPLHLVITPSALEKYDQIFKLLLRVTRMLFVVSHQLPRQGIEGIPGSKSFRLEAHHFVTSVAAYFFDTGIDETWTAFSKTLDDLERRLQREDDAEQFGQLVTKGLESVRVAHETCLDGILFSLLLRRRQAQIMKLLEEMFEAILGFAKLAATTNRLTLLQDAISVKELYSLFKSKLGVFISVCRGLAGKRGYAKGQAAISDLFGGKRPAEENTIERLLLKLEMNGYHALPPQIS